MVDMSKVREMMLKVPMPDFFKQARHLGLDVRGQSNKERILQTILEKVEELPAKEVATKLDSTFRAMAEASGALSATKESAKSARSKGNDEEAPTDASSSKTTDTTDEGESVQTTARESVSENKKGAPPKKTAKKGGEEKPVKESSKDTTPAKKEVAAIEFPQARLDKIVDADFKAAESETSTGVKAAFCFYGKHYAEVQDIFEELHREVVKAREAGKEIPKGALTTMSEYLESKDYYAKLERSDQRLRKDAIIWRAVSEEGKMPDAVLERLKKIKTAKAEAVASLPKPREAIMKGILVDGKTVALENLTKKQVEEAVKKLTGRDTKPGSPRAKSALIDVPRKLDPIMSIFTTLKKKAPDAKLLTDKALVKRLREVDEFLPKFQAWLKETLDSVPKDKEK